MIKFIFPFVLCQIAAQVTALGSIVYSSMYTGSLSGPALMALIQAMANGSALLITQRISFQKAPQLIFLGTMLFSITNAAITYVTGDISVVSLFMRLLTGAMLNSLLLSQGPRIISNDINKSNQIIQGWASVSSLIGFGLAPILATSVKSMFAFDVLLNAIALGTFAINSGTINFTVFFKEDAKSSFNIDLFEKSIFYLGLASFVLWCFGGFFHVIEVPLLLQRFGLNQVQLSSIFIITLIFNIISITTLNRNLIAKKPWTTLILATLGLGISSIAYLGASKITTVWIIVSVIGITNGAFNLSQTTLLQKIESPQARLSSFIFVRLLGQVGMMIGALLAGSGVIIGINQLSMEIEHRENNKNTNEKTLNILVENLPKNLYPFKNSDASSMLVIHQIFENLFEYDNRNNLVPKLTESMNWNKDKTKLSLKIKKTIRFSNGDELITSDVATAIIEAKKHLGESGNWAFGELKNIKTLSDSEMEFEFKRPYTLFPAILASPYFGIYKLTREQGIIGTGNYQLGERTENKIFLKTNKFKKVSSEYGHIIITDKENKSLKYDISVKKIKGMALHKFNTLQTILFILNTKNNDLKSKQARCDIRNEISKIAPKVYTKWRPTDLGLQFSNDMFHASKNKEKTNKATKRKIRIYYSNSAAKFETSLNNEIIEKLKNSGIDAEFKQIPIQELVTKGQTGNFKAMMFGYVPDFVHPHALIGPLLKSNQLFNFSQYSDQNIDRLLNKATIESDRSKQYGLYREIIKATEEACATSFLGSQAGEIYITPLIEAPEIGQLGFYNIDLSKIRGKTGEE